MGRNEIIPDFYLLIFAAACLSFTSLKVSGQNLVSHDTTILLRSGSVIRTPAGITIIQRDSLLKLPSGLKTVPAVSDHTTRIFYDSLRYRASRTLLGRRIYDLVIVPPEEYNEKIISNRSISEFTAHNGLSVNSVKIIRLHPFGTDIMNPDSDQSGTTGDLLLNRTHWKTRESIIRKYLLFGNGDTISGLLLSETERNLRNLPFIFDARIVVVPLSESDADILVITRDSYSAGGDFSYRSPEKGEVSLFERNIAGYAHGLELGIPYDLTLSNRPGIRLKYSVNNIVRSYADLDIVLLATPAERNYGFSLKRDFISAESEYAGGITVREVYTSTGPDTVSKEFPLEFTFQDYWFARSFLLSRNSLARIIVGTRYIHNNVYERPEIDPLSYYSLQKYQLYLGSITFSMQRFYKTSYIYNYGRTEDIPYGIFASFTAGREINEFKRRNYYGLHLSAGNSPGRIGYINLAAGASLFSVNGITEQGVIDLSASYFTSLLTAGNWKLRGFIRAGHTAGFNRYTDEYLTLGKGNMVTGFTNDSIRGQSRTVVNTEFVAFSPLRVYGFRFTFFAFSDFAIMNRCISNQASYTPVKAIGGGIRIRNNNLILSTFQIRLAWYPGIPDFSETRFVNFSGEQLLRPRGFDAGPPSVLVYR